jgi:hypothetical protein
MQRWSSRWTGVLTPRSNSLGKPDLALLEMNEARQARPDPVRSVQELVGLGAGDSPAPDDETVRRWIAEQRMEKYGW